MLANFHLSDWTDLIVYAAIAIVTLIGVLRCLIPLWRATGSVRRAVRRLERDTKVASGERPVWQESRFMGRRLRGAWLRFLQNAEQLDRRGLPCDVENYINDETVVYGPGNAQLAELVPNLLTSLGILGTFLGMMQGLTGLDMGNAESVMTSIPKLLEGMRFAFGTSVAGISCSLIFNMLNRISQGSGFRAVDDFTEVFTQLAMNRPLDNDVQLICQNQDRNHMLFNATDGLTTRVTTSIEGALTRVMSPVARSMDNFIAAATHQQIEGVNRIVNSFVRSMNESLSGQFLKLGETLTAVNTSQELSRQRLDESMNAAAGIVREVEDLQRLSDQLVKRFAEYIETVEAGRRHDETYEQSHTALLERMNRMLDAQKEENAELRGFQRQLGADLTRFSRECNTAADRLASLNRENSAAAAGAQRQLSDACRDFVTGVTGGVDTALNGFERRMGEMTAVLGDWAKTVPEGQGAAALTEVQRLLTEIRDLLSSGRKEA